MKIKVDENLPAIVASILCSIGHDALTVPQEGLAGKDDSCIWKIAQEEGRFLITQDLDFSDRSRFAPGTHHGILLLRLRKPGCRALSDRVRWLFSHENVDKWKRCFVVATERKLRILSPAEKR